LKREVLPGIRKHEVEYAGQIAILRCRFHKVFRVVPDKRDSRPLSQSTG
jgi:hypothetical protein